MYYITLDLEWNQAYAQKALAVQRRLACRLRGEVIQIGAVKLDSRMNICGSYQIIVKPQYFKKLHRHVSELTGITQEQMDEGTPLPEAAERFKKWCGKDFAFLTWGPDDIPMLKENFNVHDLPSAWLDKVYDLQLIFSRQTEDQKKQFAEYVNFMDIDTSQISDADVTVDYAEATPIETLKKRLKHRLNYTEKSEGVYR